MLKRAMLRSVRWTLWIMMKSQERLWRRFTAGVFYVLLLVVFIDRAGLDLAGSRIISCISYCSFVCWFTGRV